MVIGLMLQIPVLTMRLVSEEKRTGSLRFMLTAPVNEWPIILSKFLATWLFFLISWLPATLFLIALRVEVGQPFDYRPLLSFYVSLAAQGLAFVGMGLFSTLTKNQIVAAVLTFAGMMAFLFCYILRVRPDRSRYGLVPSNRVRAALVLSHVGGVALRAAPARRHSVVFVAGSVLAIPLCQGAGNPQVELTTWNERPLAG